MRSEKAKFLSIGAQVSAPATLFDIPDEPRWSEAVYGSEWATARVVGTVVRMVRSRVWVRFEDGDEQCLPINDIQLLADTLPRADVLVRAALGGIENDAGPSVRFDGDSVRTTRPRGSESSDDERPLYTLRRGPHHSIGGATRPALSRSATRIAKQPRTNLKLF
jgi:hypothetical protein